MQNETPETETLPETESTHDSVAMLQGFLEDTGESEAQAESEQEETEVSEDVQEDEQPEDGEDQPDEAEEAEPVEIELKHDGKIIKKTLDEVKNLAQQGFDYSQKMQRLNAEREQVSYERQAAEATKQELIAKQQSYVESMSIIERFLKETDISQSALDKLLEEGDTEGYLNAKNQRDRNAQRIQSIRATIAAEHEAIKEREAAYIAHQMEQGKAALSEVMPHLLQPEGAGKLAQYLNTEYGFTQDQIRSETNHKLFILAEKARMYDEMVAKAKTVKPAQKPMAKPLKNKATPVNGNEQSKAYKAALERVKSGDRQATVDALKFFV